MLVSARLTSPAPIVTESSDDRSDAPYTSRGFDVRMKQSASRFTAGINVDPPEAVRVEVDAASATRTDSFFGIACGASPDNAYALQISQGGDWVIGRVVDASLCAVRRGSTHAVCTGTAGNHIVADCSLPVDDDATLALMVNGRRSPPQPTTPWRSPIPRGVESDSPSTRNPIPAPRCASPTSW
jgi:hypothetical protein